MTSYFDRYALRVPREPAPWAGAPAWVLHLEEHHPTEARAGRRLAELFPTTLAWPSRRELHAGLKHRYRTAVDVENALEEIDRLFNLRAQGCPEHEGDCGHAVYKITVKNPRGPVTIHYGLVPFLNVAAVRAKPSEKITVQRVAPQHIEQARIESRFWSMARDIGRPSEDDEHRDFIDMPEMAKTLYRLGY